MTPNETEKEAERIVNSFGEVHCGERSYRKAALIVFARSVHNAAIEEAAKIARLHETVNPNSQYSSGYERAVNEITVILRERAKAVTQ